MNSNLKVLLAGGHSSAIADALAHIPDVKVVDDGRGIALSRPHNEDLYEKLAKEMQRLEDNEISIGSFRSKGSSHQTRTDAVYIKRRVAAKAARKARKKNRK